MNLVDRVRRAVAALREDVPAPGAVLKVEHLRPYDYDDRRKVWLKRPVDDAEVVAVPRFSHRERVNGFAEKVRMGLLSAEEVHNILLNVGRVFMHQQCYATSGLGANGLNYVAVTNDATAPAATDTTLTSEITTNGLARAQGIVTLATGTGNQTTVARTFTCSGSAQASQKAALFTASSAGIMNHEATYTQRTVQPGDDLIVTYTCTLG